MIPISLAVEDELSEAVLRRLLEHAGRNYHVGNCYRRGGYGYLRRTIAGWNRAARGRPFIVLTDLDNHLCAPALIDQWLTEPVHPNLLFRIAVREVESWLLADAENLPVFLHSSAAGVPPAPDYLPDPKQALIDLARRSRSSDIKSRIVPRADSTAKQGPDYNACLCTFVANGWNIDGAQINSPSLSRTIIRLAAFEPVWP